MRRGRIIGSFGLSLVFLLAAMACAAQEAEGLYGTWLNTSGHGGYKFALFPDGTATYVNSDSSIKSEGRFVIEKKWTDADGNIWYMTSETWHIAPYQELGAISHYVLSKLDSSGQTLEAQGSMYGYPDEFFGPLGMGSHQLYQRQ